VSPPRLSRSAIQELSLAAVITLVCLGFSLLSGRFADLDNLRNVVLQAAPTVIAAVGMTFVIATRGIDLSIGSVMNLALCAAVALTGTRIEAELTTRTTWLVYPVALAAGALLGTLAALPIYWLMEGLLPGFIAASWYLDRLSGVLLLGIPLEDLVWYLYTAALWGVYYKYLEGWHVVPRPAHAARTAAA
jgi:ribose transport system permease protein